VHPAAALNCAALADPMGAHAALLSYAGVFERRLDADGALHLSLAVRVALLIDDVSLAERLGARQTPPAPLYEHARTAVAAMLTEARGEHGGAAAAFADAAARWRGFGIPYEEAQALLGQGRCLVALGSAPEAAAPLAAAREIFARLGARPALVETDGLMQQAASA
jgi:hypothetical protein